MAELREQKYIGKTSVLTLITSIGLIDVLIIASLIVIISGTDKSFSSVNNYANSFDYPSMYNHVNGVGVVNEANFNYIDFPYKSNILCVVKKGFRFFNGTSYLSLYQTVKSSMYQKST